MNRPRTTATCHVTGNPITASDAIGACIQVCAHAPDERGRWRAERWCAGTLDLLHPGVPGINRNAAAAARRLGAWLATREARP